MAGAGIKNWENPQPPIDLGGGLKICPACNNEIVGPFGAVLANGANAKKWACSNPRCNYVWKLELGYRTAAEAAPITFG